jgi:hypothetical protein
LARFVFGRHPLADIDAPIHNRSLVIDLEMTRAEILERMEALLPSFKTNATSQQRRLAMDFIRRWAPSMQQLSLRTFISVVRIIMRVAFSICSGAAPPR